MVYEHLLASIHDGSLQPGDRLSDGRIAEEFEVSRTPVREALQRLRDIGVVEASANRFTRVAVVSPRQTIDAMAVWVALCSALVREVVQRVDDDMLERMEQHHRAFVSRLPAQDFQDLARANFDFYAELRAASRNEALLRSLNGVVHMIRLGSLHLPEAIDLEQLAGWQSALLEALRARDLDGALTAVDGLRGIRIPQA